jgi:hypothetical protein
MEFGTPTRKGKHPEKGPCDSAVLLSLKFKDRFIDSQLFFWNEVVHEIALSFTSYTNLHAKK